MSTGLPGATSSNSTIGSARSGVPNGRSAGPNTEKKNHMDEVLRRKAEAEKIVTARKAALISEQNEKLRKIQEQRDRERKDRVRLQHDKELRRQKEALDRRQTYLDALNNKKEAILARAHAASSRTAQNKKQTFAFGSSTPRDISYLQSVPKEQRQYDKKLMPTMGPAPPSPKASPPPSSKPVKKPTGQSPMTASMYVPAGTPTRTPRQVKTQTSPPKSTAKPNLMTQSMYSPSTPASIRSTMKPLMTSTPKIPKTTPVASQRKVLPPVPTPRPPTKKTGVKAEEQVDIAKALIEQPVIPVQEKQEKQEEKLDPLNLDESHLMKMEAVEVHEQPKSPSVAENDDSHKNNEELLIEEEKVEEIIDEPNHPNTVEAVPSIFDQSVEALPQKERSLNDELAELLISDNFEQKKEEVVDDEESHGHVDLHPPFDTQPEEPVNLSKTIESEPEMLLDLGELKVQDHEEQSQRITEQTNINETIDSIKEPIQHDEDVENHQKENGNSEHTDTSTSGDEEVAEAVMMASSTSPIPPASTSSPPSSAASALRPPTPEERKAELLAKLEQEEKEREARKARLAAIMSRTRGGQGGEAGGGDSPVQTPPTSLSSQSTAGGMSALEKVAIMSGSSRINQILRREGSGSNLGTAGGTQTPTGLSTSISDGALPGQVHDQIIA